jgi:hydroxypyruvate isomerase
MTFSRRAFLGATGSALAAAMLPSSRVFAGTNTVFDLNFAPHPGMFRHLAGDGILDQIDFAADQGFTAWEDNGMKGRDVALQEKAGRLLAKRSMTMGVFVAHEIHWKKPTMSLGDSDYVAQFLKEIKQSIPVAKRTGARWMTVVPGHVDMKLHLDYQMGNLAECLKRASEILEPHGLTMVLEPLNNYENHPGLILKEIPQAWYLCKAVGSPSCKILFDMYHQQIQEGRITRNIDAAWNEIAYFQIGDTPGRDEPTTGEMNYRNIFRHIKAKGYTGVLGMEHGNSQEGAEGERAVIRAYRETGSNL